MTMQSIYPAFNRAILAITGIMFQEGFDVKDDAPETFEDAKAYHALTGRVCVWSGASDNTIYASPFVNYAFRAWHDWRHICFGNDFTLSGERATMRDQQRDIDALWASGFLSANEREVCRAILEAEIIGQAMYKDKHGDFPNDQRQFVLDYLKSEKGTVI